jgi:hypothetical protein
MLERSRSIFLAICAVVVLVVLAGASSASAASPWWDVSSGATPSNLPPGGEGTVTVTVANIGDAHVVGAGNPVIVVDTLPAGLTATGIAGTAGIYEPGNSSLWGPVTCSLSSLTCAYEGSLPPSEELHIRIKVKAEGDGGENEVNVSGGGAPAVTVKHPLTVSSAPVAFGVEDYEMTAENENGAPDTQAGSHPFQTTVTLALNKSAEGQHQPALPKDLRFKLPPGYVGNPIPFAQCTNAQFATTKGLLGPNECPTNTAMGVATVSIFVPVQETSGIQSISVPVFNLVPATGEPARFGFVVDGNPVVLDTSVRTGEDYGVTVTVPNITEVAAFYGSRVTLWGTPGDPRHNSSRGWGCTSVGQLEGICKSPEDSQDAPFLTLPTSCGNPVSEPWESSMTADSWSDPSAVTQPSVYDWHDESGQPLALDGCNRLAFDPSITVAPDGPAASTPTGLTVGVRVPQETLLLENGTAQSDVRSTTVVLPAGVAVNPASADGLQACSEAQIALSADSAALCPETSKVATVEIGTPLLPEPLVGEVYLAAQDANPFGSLVALYIVAEDPKAGVLVKLAGEVKLDPVSGQLVTTFKNTPQLPFETLKLHFFGDSRAPLGTPALCGSYVTHASIEPWSGNSAAEASSEFQITTGPNGGPCADPLPFAPSLTAGSLNLQAGAFTPFTTTMSREDGQQNLGAIQLHMPPGVSGLLSNVKLCPEPQADQGTCGPESEIGETIVSVGLGDTPYSVKGGKVFITEGYEGGSYGLSIVNPAKAGPYDLGIVVVRAKIEVNPITAALTITTSGTGPYAIPHIIDGIPLAIQHVNVLINRPGFTFNPTNCEPMSITGTITSTEGATSNLSVPLQVTNCAVLGFKPGFSVSTSGKTSRADGASLHVKLTYPKAPFGSQANIKSVKVDLPKQLPSRLTTLQKACPAKTFEANPAGCPAASIVGHAVAITPLIPVPLAGPAYFVSYGGAKFPELVIALQGYGVTLDLHGETFISKAGITSSTFHTVPDAPVGSFELTLPQGPDSALAANGNLCKSKLAMPTLFDAQNGMVIKQSTPISVTGCSKVKKAKKKTKHHKKKK